MLGNLLTVFIAGRFSDAWGRKTALFVFQSLSGIFMLTGGLVSNYEELVVVRVLNRASKLIFRAIFETSVF